MNIAIDVQPLYSGHSSRGIGNYTVSLLSNLFSIDKLNKYYIINFYGKIPAKEILNGGDNVIELNYFANSKKYLLENATIESKKYFNKCVRKIIKNYQIDIFHITAAVDQFDIYDVSFFSNTKFITTLYDLIPLVFPKNYLAGGTYPEKYRKCLEQYIFADTILADSDSAKKDAITYLGVNNNCIKTIYSGVNNYFKKKRYENNYILDVNKKYDITSPYLICVGADDFRKNLDRLVEAFCKLDKNLLNKFQLVIVCSIREEAKQKLLDIAKKMNADKHVVITGYISDDDMLCLLNNAHMAVFPSLYEGFGLPVIEAWKCEIPVLTSNNSSLGEIAKDAAITVNPFSVEDILKGLTYALIEANFEDLIQRGNKELKKYSWDIVAENVIKIYKEIEETPKKNWDNVSKMKIKFNLEKVCMRCLTKKQRLYIRVRNILKTEECLLPIYKILRNIKMYYRK